MTACIGVVGFVMSKGYAVIQTERPETRNVEANTHTHVVVPAIEIETVGLFINVADIVENGETKAFDDGHAVLSRAVVVALAPNWLVISTCRLVLRTNRTVFITAKSIHAPEEILVEERNRRIPGGRINVSCVAERINNADASNDL